jgi:hypothetical protein
MGREAREPIVLSLRVERWVADAVRKDERFSQFISKFNFPAPAIA